LGDPGVDGRNNIKMDLEEVDFGGTDWIELAQSRERWRALLTVEINLRLPKMRRNFLTS
jgi:hypothetical protein